MSELLPYLVLFNYIMRTYHYFPLYTPKSRLTIWIIEVGTSSLVYTYSTETASINKHNFVLTATHVGAPGDEDAGDDSSSTTGTVEAYINGWTNIAYCTVDFGTTDQEVSMAFYNWLNANATINS